MNSDRLTGPSLSVVVERGGGLSPRKRTGRCAAPSLSALKHEYEVDLQGLSYDELCERFLQSSLASVDVPRMTVGEKLAWAAERLVLHHLIVARSRELGEVVA